MTCSRWRSQLQHRRLESLSTHVLRKTAFSPDRQNGAPGGMHRDRMISEDVRKRQPGLVAQRKK